MTRKNISIDTLAAVSARQAQSQMAMMQRDLRALSDRLAGYSRAIKAPIPKGGSRTIKGSRSSPSLLDDLGAYAAGDLLGEIGLDNGVSSSFYVSAAQSAGTSQAALTQAQRIR